MNAVFLRWNPDAIAYFEAEGWRAYYDRKLLRGLWLMVQLVHSQFGLSWPQSLFAALDIVRAYRAFQPVDGNHFLTRRYLRRFFRRVAARLARYADGLPFDPAEAARRELDYWIVHRLMSGNPNREPLVRSLETLHTVLFGGDPGTVRASAEHRAAATVAVDRITGGVSTHVAADWETVHRELRAAYRSLNREL